MSFTFTCEVTGCEVSKTASSEDNALKQLELHHKQVHQHTATTTPTVKQKPPKVNRPKISLGMSGEEWMTFTHKWDMFKAATDIGSSELNAQLLQCCDEELENSVYASCSTVRTGSEADLLGIIKGLCVIDVAESVRVTELMQMTQGHGEFIRTFAARLRNKAQVCTLATTCGGCSRSVSFQDEIIKFVLLNGIAVDDIKKEVLGHADVDTKDLSQTISLIESKEKASRALAPINNECVALSSYKKKKRTPPDTTPKDITACASCRKSCPKFGVNRNGKTAERKFCDDCWRARRKPAKAPNAAAAVREDHDVFDGLEVLQLGCINEVRQGSIIIGKDNSSHHSNDNHNSSQLIDSQIDSPQFIDNHVSLPPQLGNFPPQPVPANSPTTESSAHYPLDPPNSTTDPAPCIASVSHKPVDNLVYDENGGWKLANSKPHPRITLTSTTDYTAYHTIRRSAPTSCPATSAWVSDTGCMSCLSSPKLVQDMKIDPSMLVPVSRTMSTATHGRITIDGALFLELSAVADGRTYRARVMVYISPQVDDMYLSRHAQEQLKIIPPSYPQVGAAAAIENATTSTCGCPARSAPPGRPAELPFPATKENAEKMRLWLIKRYSASTFNKCPHQPLPAMSGPPLKIRVADSAIPVVTRRSPKTPTHWKEDIKTQLDQDVALGVIEKVPPGTPTTWLHSMVTTPKSDGSPRRTIDLQPLNKVSVREKHHVVPPAEQVRTVPKNQAMTVFDAWNGYHSIPVDPEDRHKLSFLTEYGVFRYCRAPQGYTASGDAYTHRYDAIVAAVPRLLKVVDDSLLYDPIDALETHWWRVIDYLELCGNNGIVLNPEPKKFQFSQPAVDYTAFHISGTRVTPLPKHIKAIEDFPTPSNITDVRAWFGLVNQVAHYGRMIDIMAPFKPLLSPKHKFAWSPELDSAFVQSKEVIIKSISKGLAIYDPKRMTCLETDYSGIGLGYWLRQKYCACDSTTPDCKCEDGWKITLVGSRFLRDAEKRYAPIEGECLGIAWALEDTKWFTLGADNLVIITDHKPLVKILGDKSLDNIANPRLFRLKQRTLMWTFSIRYLSGKSNLAADAASRYPTASEDDIDCTMEADMAAGLQSQIDSSGAITWSAIRSATAVDKDLSTLANYVSSGFPADKADIPLNIRPYWQYKDRLSIIDGVVMLDNRMVVPATLVSQVLMALHSAHQGTSGMQSRAQECVFWLGMSADIHKARTSCPTCSSIAPSQPHMPPIAPLVPQYPFQAIVADYFALRSIKYLIIVDRFSGWPHLVRAKNAGEAVGSAGLIRTLRTVFATFGVPEELSSDGGPEFTAEETKMLLKRWDIIHRLSAAYNPVSNGRAEVGVKTMKRLLEGCIRSDGSLDTDAVVAGLLQYRNTPDPSTGLSPANILFGRNLRDRIPIPPGTSIFNNSAVSPVWQQMWKVREAALSTRFAKQVDTLTAHSRDLGLLKPHDQVRIQNLCGVHPKRWDRSGQVIEQLPHDQYLVKTHGTGRILRRNRRHLRQNVDTSPKCSRTFSAPAVPPSGGPALPAASSAAETAPPHSDPMSRSPPPVTPDPAGPRAPVDNPEPRPVPMVITGSVPAAQLSPTPEPTPTRSRHDDLPLSPSPPHPSSPSLHPPATTCEPSSSLGAPVETPNFVPSDMSNLSKSTSLANPRPCRPSRSTAGTMPARYDDFIMTPIKKK